MHKGKQVLVPLKALKEELGGEYDIQTRLRESVQSGNVDAVCLLIAAGADINKQRDDKKHGADLTPLMLAIIYGQFDCAKLLIAAGADLETKDLKGRTALSWATSDSANRQVARKRLACTKLLIARGADCSVADVDGQTVLSRAQTNAYAGYSSVVDLLRQASSTDRGSARSPSRSAKRPARLTLTSPCSLS